jgi:DNA-binding NarL/FixJ family response regulator
MASRGMAGQGCGSQPTGEKHPRGPATRPAPACLRCAFWQHFHHHPASDLRLPTRLRVALVDGDPGAHDFVRQTFKAHAEGWTLDSHRSPDSLLAAMGFPPIALHSAPLEPSTNCDVPHPHTPHYQLSTSPTINRHLDAPPDIVLMEPKWPGFSGIDCVRWFIARQPKSRFVMFTACAEYDTIVGSLVAGALGYLVKPVAAGNLVYTLSEAAQGRVNLSGQAQGTLIDFACRLGGARRSSSLSWRESEVMLLLLKGASSKQISEKLGICEGTVNRHLHDSYRKLGVHRKTDALRKFVG